MIKIYFLKERYCQDWIWKNKESADKPGSVEGNHSSRAHVTIRLKQPTRKLHADHMLLAQG